MSKAIFMIWLVIAFFIHFLIIMPDSRLLGVGLWVVSVCTAAALRLWAKAEKLEPSERSSELFRTLTVASMATGIMGWGQIGFNNTGADLVFGLFFAMGVLCAPLSYRW